ncbi:MAG: hypothetical protein HYZ23_05030 [Chloroflexi bacterium]|nr:hypothetical protein [Chloroflexota bacterium]
MSPGSSPAQRALTIVLILLGVAVTFFFGMRALHAFQKFNGHRPPPPDKVETDTELIRDWMTVPYVARMYHVPDKFIFEALNIPKNGNKDKSLEELNREYYPDRDGFVLAGVKQAVLAHLPPPRLDSTP